MASQGFVFPSQLDFSHPMVSWDLLVFCLAESWESYTFSDYIQGHIPFHYAEPYFGSLFAAACGPQATVSAWKWILIEPLF